MIVLIDNYDSFTWNLADLLRRHTPVQVFRNDAIVLEELAALRPAGVVISPGPGRPEDSRISVDIVRQYHRSWPILGVCLGHQLIGMTLGMKVVKARRPMHGRTSMIRHNGEGLFESLGNPLCVMRYHSLLLSRRYVPAGLELSAASDAGEIMAIRHRIWPLTGVQFHPESILSAGGEEMIKNWLRQL